MSENMFNKIEELPVHNFTHEIWSAGSLAEFGIQTRTETIELNKQIIREYAIGYLKGNKLWVRPKENTFAVMFWFNEQHFWTHLTEKEFFICFPELKIIS